MKFQELDLSLLPPVPPPPPPPSSSPPPVPPQIGCQITDLSRPDLDPTLLPPLEKESIETETMKFPELDSTLLPPLPPPPPLPSLPPRIGSQIAGPLNPECTVGEVQNFDELKSEKTEHETTQREKSESPELASFSPPLPSSPPPPRIRSQITGPLYPECAVGEVQNLEFELESEKTSLEYETTQSEAWESPELDSFAPLQPPLPLSPPPLPSSPPPLPQSPQSDFSDELPESPILERDEYAPYQTDTDGYTPEREIFSDQSHDKMAESDDELTESDVELDESPPLKRWRGENDGENSEQSRSFTNSNGDYAEITDGETSDPPPMDTGKTENEAPDSTQKESPPHVESDSPDPPDRLQIVCGECEKLSTYTRGSSHIRCPWCKAVNMVLERSQSGTVHCEKCSMHLIYPYGFPAVECFSCLHVTKIGPHNLKPPLSVQLGEQWEGVGPISDYPPSFFDEPKD